MDDYWDSDESCPKCGHGPTRVRHCDVIGCDDGWVDEYDEDPINCSPGEYVACSECRGAGIVRWCPKCGADLIERVADDIADPPGEPVG
jgi:hypothetical protein